MARKKFFESSYPRLDGSMQIDWAETVRRMKASERDERRRRILSSLNDVHAAKDPYVYFTEHVILEPGDVVVVFAEGSGYEKHVGKRLPTFGFMLFRSSPVVAETDEIGIPYTAIVNSIVPDVRKLEAYPKAIAAYSRMLTRIARLQGQRHDVIEWAVRFKLDLKVSHWNNFLERAAKSPKSRLSYLNLPDWLAKKAPKTR